ncbi:MAG: hypothetical protein FJ100_15675 [Deltaproteobacteria bacterium]|nr:hypothetical protein [Deltaproteobacteria bacterium]
MADPRKEYTVTDTKTHTATRTAVRTRAEFDRALRQVELPAQEENVLRMRYGIAAADDHPLQMRGQDDPALAQALAEIESRALAAFEAGVDANKRSAIIERMRKL